jgi:four helix bundle protein
MNTFKDIVAWKRGYQLTLLIYKLSSHFPPNEEFGLKSQLRRASVSIISNIAEGFRRNSIKNGLHFYNCSQASLEEVKCQSMLARDLNCFSQKDYDEIDLLSEECSKNIKRLDKISKKSSYYPC